MQFTKALLFLSALAPVAFAAESTTADCVTQTITLVPSGYTPPPSSTSTPTSTSTATEISSSTWTPVVTSTPSSSSTPSMSRIASSSTRLIKASSTPAGGSAWATPSAPAVAGAASIHLPAFMAAGVAAIAGLLVI
ncbi:hypothetical protein Pdw03_7735 [Penicillium digitatum]|uniref:GPI anchored protein n=3 Tax=Penicillium digitatum TaxID=36651 RepID=K9G757_PEND2|nr:hypothetical protein PDIP_56620 [Penicillium digitatum Pd1]EKV11348.1 hypothetical protein PDIP_56620 [Penicillium digitatum Pd1]EKV16777.1 hypothetical protein PDIG_18790 [Penicillium digitatum PHI26]KAG0153053.1 hypothetical protein PDIDSM_2012 [Penicillium digitatum]QQK43834.1 hypothetical protein Pdw03_7735 [Penicillium digitatum]